MKLEGGGSRVLHNVGQIRRFDEKRRECSVQGLFKGTADSTWEEGWRRPGAPHLRGRTTK